MQSTWSAHPGLDTPDEDVRERKRIQVMISGNQSSPTFLFPGCDFNPSLLATVWMADDGTMLSPPAKPVYGKDVSTVLMIIMNSR